MTALHAPPTVPTLTDRDAKLMDEGALHREVFLILRDDAPTAHRASTVRTLGGQRHFMPDIDVPRRSSMRAAAIGGTGLSTGSLGMFFGQPARKRRRLTIGAAAGHLELVFQPLVLAPQPIAFDLRPLQILAQPFILAPQVLNRLRRPWWWRRVGSAPRHDPVMPDSTAQYKRKRSLPQRLGVS
jgi:hypothetical protein